MKKISFYVLLLLVCMTAVFYGYSMSLRAETVLQQDTTATYEAWFHQLQTELATERATHDYTPTIAGTPRDTNTPWDTNTPAPSKTLTPSEFSTFDYPALVDHYLTPSTPYPTRTKDPNYRPPLPTATDVDVLSQISVQKLPAGWTPTPPPHIEPFMNEEWTPLPPTRDWRIAHIQAVTDLMNFANANETVFLNNVDTWSQIQGLTSGHWSMTWLLKKDFDGDGEPEWLVSIPAYFVDFQIFCCNQIMILYEKSAGLYHPVYYQVGGGHHVSWRLLKIADLNQDGLLEVVTSTTTCGSACSFDLDIGTWDGQHWKTNRIDPNGFPTGVSFFDTDHNGTTEIVVQSRTVYKLLSSYPNRKVTDIYSWKDGKFSQLEAWIQPNVTPNAIVGDANKQLLAHHPQEVLRLAQPVMDKLPQQCDVVESMIALQVMLAYAIDNQPKAMQETLAKIIKFCRTPDNNGYIPAANFLWVTYQKTHDPLRSCQAMERFIQEIRMYKTSDGNPMFNFFAHTIMDYRSFCLPRQ